MSDETQSQLQTWLTAVEHVPHQVQSSITSYRMVQHLYQTTLDRINQLSDEDRIPDSRKAEIYNLFLTLQELGDKKVELTRAIKQTFEIASDEIKLDFHELESGDLYDSYRSDRKKESDTPESRKDSTKTKRKKIREDRELKKDGKRRKIDKKRDEVTIKPRNEPTYCFCHQVSYGNMICCDNNKCEVGWFHFSCVGISNKPKGKWYCPPCRPSKSTSGRGRKRKDSEKMSENSV